VHSLDSIQKAQDTFNTETIGFITRMQGYVISEVEGLLSNVEGLKSILRNEDDEIRICLEVKRTHKLIFNDIDRYLPCLRTGGGREELSIGEQIEEYLGYLTNGKKFWKFLN
jgi:hypothetical protein